MKTPFLKFLIPIFVFSTACFASDITILQEVSNLNNCAEIITLKAQNVYIDMDKKAQSEAVKSYADNKALTCMKLKHIYIVGDDFAELWKVEGGTRLLDSMNYSNIANNDTLIRPNKWFFSFAFSKTGGDYKSNGVNMRIGSLLHKNKYDIAMDYNLIKYRDYDYYSRRLGFSLRRLYRASEHGGYNLGLKFSNSDYNGEIENFISVLTGFSVYIPNGGLDLTMEYGARGRVWVGLGYTVYIGK